MPLKVNVSITVGDGYTDGITVQSSRAVIVPEQSYRDPRPKGYNDVTRVAEAMLDTMMTDLAEAARIRHQQDMERVNGEVAKLAEES